MRLRPRIAFWLFSGLFQKSGSAISSSSLESCRCLAGASKIAPHGESLLAERGVFSFQFVDGHSSCQRSAVSAQVVLTAGSEVTILADRLGANVALCGEVSVHKLALVGRSPWTAADALVGPVSGR